MRIDRPLHWTSGAGVTQCSRFLSPSSQFCICCCMGEPGKGSFLPQGRLRSFMPPVSSLSSHCSKWHHCRHYPGFCPSPLSASPGSSPDNVCYVHSDSSSPLLQPQSTPRGAGLLDGLPPPLFQCPTSLIPAPS